MVRYEVLCIRAESINDVLWFVDSDISVISELGEFLRSDAQRVAEGQLHGGQISDKRVARWRQESGALAEEAQQVFDLMKAYCDFWGYGQNGPLEFAGLLSQNSVTA
jgi:hypothetical protein